MTLLQVPSDDWLEALANARAQGLGATLVTILEAQGSAPREGGTKMLVTSDGQTGSIGGGHLEFEAIAQARRMLAAGTRVALRDVVLGASMGQCCGGAVTLSMRRIDAREQTWTEALAAIDETGGTRRLATRLHAAPEDAAPHTTPVDEAAGAPSPVAVPVDGAAARRDDGPEDDAQAGVLVSRVDAAPWPVWLFGAGHVGEAIARVLATLPLRMTWVDPRADRLPASLPANVAALESDSPAHEVASIPAGADVLVMTHSHALDFDLCLALLGRDDLGSVGVIGSATKAASFRARLARRGADPVRLARLRCPIGEPPRGDTARHALDRHPGAIAVAVAHELWSLRRARTAAPAAAAGAAR
jgi:xanthine dehydrogenase accessory factor